MARKKKSPPRPRPRRSPFMYLPGEASWHAEARQKGKSTLLATERRLRDGLKLARKLYSGLTPERGFDARRLKHFPTSRLEALNRLIAEANRLTSGEFHELYTLHRPRTEEQRRALILHSGLGAVPVVEGHPQKAWPIYANTRQVKIRYVRERTYLGAAMGRPIYEDITRAEIRRAIPGGTLVHRDYLFREILGFQPGIDSQSEEGMRVGKLLGTFDPWQQMLEAMKGLLPYLPDRTRNGNEVYYRLLSEGRPIGVSYPKHMLLEKMQDWGEDYGQSRGFVGALTGVRYVGDEFKAVRGPQSQDARGERRRARYKLYAEERAKARSRISRTGALHPLPRKKKSVKKSKSAKRRKAPRRHK